MREQGPDSTYWLFNWLDRLKITDGVQLRRALDSRTNLSDIRERALEWTGRSIGPGTEWNLVAGSGLGVYNGLSCTNPPCRIHQIDVLYRHAWHYFDYIYLPDAAGDLLRKSATLVEANIDELAQLIESAMYIRQIGAENLTRYYSSDSIWAGKPNPPEGEEWEKVWDELECSFLNRPERFEITNLARNKYEISYDDPELGFVPSIEVDLRSVPKSQRQATLRSLLAENMVYRHRKSFTSDIVAARKLGGSLGSTIWSHRWALSKIEKEVADGGIFFNMEFPSLQNVSVADLISIRLEHRDSFIACRNALRKAIHELSESRGPDHDNISDEIVRDVVMPEVARLTTKLDAARSVLAKKSAVALTIAGISTWCGVHFGLGMATSLGAGALTALASGVKEAAYKYSEEKRDLEVSDMSFLWKALQCADR